MRASHSYFISASAATPLLYIFKLLCEFITLFIPALICLSFLPRRRKRKSNSHHNSQLALAGHNSAGAGDGPGAVKQSPPGVAVSLRLFLFCVDKVVCLLWIEVLVNVELNGEDTGCSQINFQEEFVKSQAE